MSVIKKVGVLIILLALPAFFFLFLKTFGTNHYDLPYYHPALDLNGEIMKEDGDTVYYRIVSPLGIEAGGDTVFASRLDGKISIFFPGRNKGAGNSVSIISRLSERLEEAKNLQYLLKSSDSTQSVTPVPENVLLIRRDTSLLDADWDVILKMNPSDLQRYSQEHSLVLVDKMRRVRGYYDLSDPDEFDRIVAEIKILVYQDKLEK